MTTAVHRLVLLSLVVLASAAHARGQDFIGFNGGTYADSLGETEDPTVVRGNLGTLLPINAWVAGSAADRGLGYRDSYATAGLVTSFWTDRQNAWYFLDARGHVSENEQFFGNVGLGRRQYVKSMGGILGINVFFDYDGDEAEEFGHKFQQVGVGGELIFERGKLNINGYIPVGRSEYQEDEEIFQGNLLIVPGVDVAFRGFDATVELPVPIPGLRPYDVRADIGAYAYQSELLGGFGGVKYGFSGKLHPNCIVNLEMNYDDMFQTTGRLQFVWHFGPSPGYVPWGGELEPVDRNEHIVRFNRPTFIAVNPATGLPWNVIHVDGDNGGFADGTAENPFPFLADAEGPGGSSPNDMIFVHIAANEDTNYNAGIALLNGQFLLGDGVQHAVPEANIGTFIIPDFTGGVRPTITNTAGAAVLLADNNRVSGFIIEGAPGGIPNGMTSGITHTGSVNNTTILDTDILNSAVGADAIALDGSIGAVTGTLTFARLNITDAGRHGIFLNETAASASFSNLAITDPNGDSIRIEDGTGGAFDFFNNDYDGGVNGVAVLRHTTGAFRFNGDDILGVTGDGVLFEDNTSITTRLENMTFTAIGGNAITYDTNTSPGAFSHSNLTITGTGGHGIFVDGNTGAMANTGITMTGVTDDGIHIENSSGPFNFANVNLTAPGGFGIFLDTVTGNATFTTLNISDPGLDAVRVQDSVGGTYTFNGGTLTAAASGTHGVAFLRHTGGQFRMTGTSITEFAGNGVLIQDGAGIDARLASVTITDSGLNGVFFDNNTGLGQVSNSILTGNGGGTNAGVRVLLDGVFGDTFTANINGNDISGNGFGIVADVSGPLGVDDGGPLLTTNINNNLNIDGNAADGILARADRGARHVVNITGNASIDGNGTAAGSGIRLDTDIDNVLGADGTTLMTANITNNNLIGNEGNPGTGAAGIDALVQLNSNLVATVNGNTIDGNGVANAGAGVGMFFEWDVTNGTVNTLSMNNNTIDGVDDDAVVFLIAGDPTRVDITANNNTYSDNAGLGMNIDTFDASVARIAVTNSLFLNNDDGGIESRSFGDSRLILNITDSTFTNNGNAADEQGIEVTALGDSVVVVNVLRNNITLSGDEGLALQVGNFETGAAAGAAQMFANVRNNVVVNNVQNGVQDQDIFVGIDSVAGRLVLEMAANNGGQDIELNAVAGDVLELEDDGGNIPFPYQTFGTITNVPNNTRVTAAAPFLAFP